MDKQMLYFILKEDNGTQIENLEPPREFTIAATNKNRTSKIIFCDQEVTLYIQLHILYGSALIQPGFYFLVTSQTVVEPLLCLPILECLGLDLHEVRAATADKPLSLIHI